MKIIELLTLINNISKEVGTSQPYICGGTPRDKILGNVPNIEDIDITTGDKTIHKLAKAVANKLGKSSNYEVMKDGHAQLVYGGLKIDFSSNFNIPGIKPLLQKAGLNPSTLQMEMYSRDFTVNALLLTMDLKTIKDPIGLSLKDIKNKVVRTCLPANITISHDHKRAVRAIYVAAKLNFSLDQEIIDYLSKNPQVFTANNDPEYVVKKLIKSFEYNATLTNQLLDKMDLWKVVPASKELLPYLKRNL